MSASSGTGYDRRYDVESPDRVDVAVLEAIPYEYPEAPGTVTLRYPEFTSVCPWSGLPDVGELAVTYIPGNKLVEMKSFKYYLVSYRNVGILQEHAVHRVLNDLVKLLEPRFMEVRGVFAPRGGMSTEVVVQHGQR